METMAEMMVGRKVNFSVEKEEARPGEAILEVRDLKVAGLHGKLAVNGVSFQVRKGEIVCIAGIDGNGQSELIYALSGLMPIKGGQVFLKGREISHTSIRQRNNAGLSHIPEDRHKYGLVLDYDLGLNLALKNYFSPAMQRRGFIRFDQVRLQANKLIERFDIRSGQGADTITRSMSGGNQQKAIIAREINTDPDLLLAVQPTRGLDVGAMIYIHKQLVKERNEGKAILLVSLELDEVFQLADRILVIYEGSLVAELQGKDATPQELGLYMAGSKKEATA
jgi:simple sugar transport system ATP-binding protein